MKGRIFRHASLFSGMGGFDLAAVWMGWENVFHCEIDPLCQQILKYYFREAKNNGDIRETNFSDYREKIDVLTGGFPCQPFSISGKRRGDRDDRYLWPEMFRAICEIRPRWVLAENVRGIINCNAGLVFEKVHADLESKGYHVWPFVLPAAGVGAPHRRERVWFVAYRNGNGSQSARILEKDHHRWLQKGLAKGYEPFQLLHVGDAAYAFGNERCKGGMHTFGPQAAEGHLSLCHPWNLRDPWKDFPSEPPVCPGDDGFPGELDGITFSAWRKKSIKAAGNAIVPHVAFQIFKTIVMMEERLNKMP